MSPALALFIASASNSLERNETLRGRVLLILHYATTYISYLLHELLYVAERNIYFFHLVTGSERMAIINRNHHLLAGYILLSLHPALFLQRGCGQGIGT